MGNSNTETRFPTSLIVIGVLVLIAAVVSLLVFHFSTVHGNEIGVKETWSGVDPTPQNAGTYVINRITTTIYPYPTSLQIFVMNDREEKDGEKGSGRTKDAYLVQSTEGQDMHISLNVQWRMDPTKVIEIHKTVHPNINDISDDVGEKLLRPIVMKVVKDYATKCTAIQAYSGDGLVKLQNDIYHTLTDPKTELREKGIIVENFVIEKIRLNDAYIKEITERQVAMQRKLKEDELTKAAEAAALRAKAEAQSNLNQAVVGAQRDKEVGILKAEQDARVAVLTAQASKERVELAAAAEQKKTVMEATGQRDAALLKAEGILAMGKSEAEAQKLRLSAYAVPGADSFVKVEIAKSLATSTQGVQGYLPSDMHIFTLGSNFQKAVESLVGGSNPPAPNK